jgi:hypothetical protein
MGLAMGDYKASAEIVLRYDRLTVKAEIIHIMNDDYPATPAANKFKPGLTKRYSFNGRQSLNPTVGATSRMESV